MLSGELSAEMESGAEMDPPSGTALAVGAELDAGLKDATMRNRPVKSSAALIAGVCTLASARMGETNEYRPSTAAYWTPSWVHRR